MDIFSGIRAKPKQPPRAKAIGRRGVDFRKDTLARIMYLSYTLVMIVNAFVTPTNAAHQALDAANMAIVFIMALAATSFVMFLDIVVNDWASDKWELDSAIATRPLVYYVAAGCYIMLACVAVSSDPTRVTYGQILFYIVSMLCGVTIGLKSVTLQAEKKWVKATG